MHKWGNVLTPSLSSKDGLFHGEERGGKGIDAHACQLTAGLQTLPGGDYFDVQPRLIEAGLQPSAQSGEAWQMTAVSLFQGG